MLTETSQDQEMLLKRAETQGATLVRIFDVVQDISKRFDVGVPPFHFFDEQTSRYYLPLGRTSLIVSASSTDRRILTIAEIL